jgi:medium-chain acyl-[acyl-carrier-protein] hydrolase
MATTPEPNRWLLPVQQSLAPRARLFCFPHAGAGGQVYNSWQGALAGHIEIWAVQYPGRGNRLRDPLLMTMESLCHGMVDALHGYVDVPFVFFGHSMGALLAFETARKLRRDGAAQPIGLCLSGSGAPDLPPGKPVHSLDTAALLEWIRKLDDEWSGSLESQELRDFLLPILRADLKICDDYRYVDAAPLNMPIAVFGGLSDPETSVEHLEGWRRHTLAEFTMTRLPGQHFLLHSDPDIFLPVLKASLSAMISTYEARHLEPSRAR